MAKLPDRFCETTVKLCYVLSSWSRLQRALISKRRNCSVRDENFVMKVPCYVKCIVRAINNDWRAINKELSSRSFPFKTRDFTPHVWRGVKIVRLLKVKQINLTSQISDYSSSSNKRNPDRGISDLNWHSFLRFHFSVIALVLDSIEKQSKQYLTAFPNSWKFVKNIPLRVVFSALSSVFGNLFRVWYIYSPGIVLKLSDHFYKCRSYTKTFIFYPQSQLIDRIAKEFKW